MMKALRRPALSCVVVNERGDLVITVPEPQGQEARCFVCISMWRMTPGIVCHPLWRRLFNQSGFALEMKNDADMCQYVIE